MDALDAADGDIDKVVSFTEKFLRIGGQNLQTTAYNSMLSNPKSHARNFLGNGVNVLIRPAAQALGHLGRDGVATRAALAQYTALADSIPEFFNPEAQLARQCNSGN